MKLVAFLGETFYKKDGVYVSRTANMIFLKGLKCFSSIKIMSPCDDNLIRNDVLAISSVEQENFISAPQYSSTQGFCRNALFKWGYLKKYIEDIDRAISQNMGSVFWIRSPSPGSLLFGLRVLRHKQILIQHICADATQMWRDPRYSGLWKIPAFLISKIIKYTILKIARNDLTVNFATGSEMERLVKRVAPDRTFQFVDLVSSSCAPSPFRDNDHFEVVFVGRIVEEKGIFDLVNAIAQGNSSLRLRIIGGGEDYARLENMVHELALGRKVQLFGQVPNDQISGFLQSADILVVPSKNTYEGFPRVIMEAWAVGVPVVVSDVGGVSAFVRNDDNGVLVEPGDVEVLRRVLDELSLRKERYSRLRNGAESMAEFSSMSYWQDHAAQKITEHKCSVSRKERF